VRWFQVIGPDGFVRPGFLRDSTARIVAAPHEGIASTLDLFVASAERGLEVEAWAASVPCLDVEWNALLAGAAPYRLTVPLAAPEVWGAGVTYRRSADFREEGSGIYDRVYDAPRPELFFKASAWRCVGPGEPIGARRDSRFTASEPELALVLDAHGTILALTLANDVSAWDIERENPLYLPQSKIYRGCFAFGPVLLTPDEVEDPYALEISCRVTREGREVFAGQASTGLLKRRFPELVEWLMRSNQIRTGTVLSTGTGIIQPLTTGLEPGDRVAISCPAIGVLENYVVAV